jgi:hypothetical protein
MITHDFQYKITVQPRLLKRTFFRSYDECA